MTILKKAFAVLTSCALMLSLAACNSEPQETIAVSYTRLTLPTT